MQTFRYLMVLGVGTTLTLGSVPCAFGTTSERIASPQTLLPQSQQSSSRRPLSLLLSSAPLVVESASTAKKSGSRDSLQGRSKPNINLSQGNVPGPQLPPLEPGSPAPPAPTPTTPSPTPSPAPPAAPTAPAPTAPPPAPSPTPPLAPTPASPEDLNLNRLNPSPDLLELPTRPSQVQLQPNQPITLQQALELARRNNRDLQVTEVTLRRARSALREAQAALYPNLTTQANLTRGQSANPPNFPGQSSPATTALTGTVQASYDLFTSGRRSANIRAAEEQVRFNELDVERLTEQLRLDVANDYYDVQQADQDVLISRAAVDNAQASVNDAQALERAGLGTRFDVLQAQVELANSTQDLTDALSRQQTSRRQLANRLSLGFTAGVSAADPVQKAPDWGRSLDDSIVLAFQNRAELLQQIAQRNISQQRRRAALADLGPQISVVARYDVQTDLDNLAGGVFDGYSVGPQLSLNLFDGGAARARAAQEEANTRIAETNFANQRNLIRFAVEQAYNNLRSSFDNIRTSSAAVAQARESLRLARLRFQAGVGIQSDVLDAVAALAQAEGNRVQAILGYNRSLVTLQREVSNLQTGAP